MASSQINNLLFSLEELYGRFSKQRSNFKKSPKDRISKAYIEGRLDILEQMWDEFRTGHRELMRSIPSVKDIKESNYIKGNMFDLGEESYLEYKCELKTALAALTVSVESSQRSESNQQSHSNVKLPKVNIPKFSGKYSEWNTFRDLFHSLVHSNCNLDGVQKLLYLKGYLSGEADQLLSNIPITENNYERCWTLLEERYNNKSHISQQVISRLLNQNNLKFESAKGLKDIVDTTNDCLATLSNLGIDVKSWDILVIHILTPKLDSESRRQWEFSVTNNNSPNDLPTYSQFTEFLTNRFRALEVLNTKAAMPGYKSQVKVNNKVKSLHLVNKSCVYCKEGHKLTQCKEFHKASVEERRKFVLDNNVCFNCMGSNHSANECRTNLKCRICKKHHHSLLHPTSSNAEGDQRAMTSALASDESCVEASSRTTSLVASCTAITTSRQQVLLATALVKARSKSGDFHSIRALLDQGSQASFVTEATAQYLGLKKLKTTGQITGLGGDKGIISKAIVIIEIQSRMNPNIRVTVKAHVIKRITSILPSKRIEAIEWQELSELELADPEYFTPNRIDLLLGAEVYSQILKDGVKKRTQGSPIIAQATSFGWILSGVVNSTSASSPQIKTMHCCTIDNDMLKQFWELESDVQMPKEYMYTDEEKRCEQHFKDNTTRDASGRYVVRLPFKKGYPEEVVGSLQIAEKRFKSLEYKLQKDETLKASYRSVINEYLALNHIELVPECEIDDRISIYLPHHAVIRNDKATTKVRVVFDASCKGRNNLSLNDQLLVGPTLQPELRHLIMQWRSPPICMSADIVKMYRQVKTEKEDSNCQRLLWREDKTAELKHYRLTRVTFGTSAAPYLAVKALQQVVADHGEEYPHASERALKHFYVDDLMTGVQTLEEGKQVFTEMTALLSKGGFEMQKWNSNCDELVKAMDVDGKVQDVSKNLLLKKDELVKIMGLTWNRSDDTFRYIVNLPTLQEPITKRKIISDISRLFDPLGWVAPTIIIPKIMIQRLWLAGLDWDEEVPNNMANEWLTYREEQTLLSEIRIPRWLGTKTNDMHAELQGFCDASKAAYAAVVYHRVVDSENKVKVSLISAKTKVAPVKQVSIPRLELCGAMLLCKLMLEVAKVMNIDKKNLHAWTDSMVVLAWLNNHPSKWTVFVANRVSEILTNLEPQNWSHVTSKQNPADCASRGLRPSELVNNKLWFHSPEFLSRETINYQKPKEAETNLEAVKIRAHFITEEVSSWEKFSSLTKTIRVMAYCRRFVCNCKASRDNRHTGYITAKELMEALNVCIKQCQEKHFSTIIEIIQQGRNLPKRCSLRSLNPFFDDDGILRVGGRLNNSSLSNQRKHPIIIPKQSHLAGLIILDAHIVTLHGGPQLTLAYVQSKYYVLGAKQLVRSLYRQCVNCTKNAAVTRNPLMGQLPAERVIPTRAFKHSGVDYAGPVQIRTSKGRGHQSYKGYICLFICMATRALHLEAVTDLTSEGFLQAYKRFVARRGHCSQLWSDNGTNFIGAATELQKVSKAEYNSIAQEIAKFLVAYNCEWHFIPPHSPNFGGLWEAGVKSVKYHLKRVIGNSTLTYEEMATVLAQIEACLNSRPLSTISDDPDSFTILTPGHFLIGEPPVTAPDHNFESSNVSTLRRWQHTQRMLQSFWRQWSQDYLMKFLRRYKWSDHISQVCVGDVCVVKEDNLPPSRWLYGRIIATHPGVDSIIRVVTLKTKNGTIKRPVSKLCILPVKVS